MTLICRYGVISIGNEMIRKNIFKIFPFSISGTRLKYIWKNCTGCWYHASSKNIRCPGHRKCQLVAHWFAGIFGQQQCTVWATSGPKNENLQVGNNFGNLEIKPFVFFFFWFFSRFREKPASFQLSPDDDRTIGQRLMALAMRAKKWSRFEPSIRFYWESYFVSMQNI